MERTVHFGGGRASGKTDAMLRDAAIHIGLDFGSEASKAAMVLYVPPSVFAKGERWIRETYRIGTDVLIIESRPLATGM